MRTPWIGMIAISVFVLCLAVGISTMQAYTSASHDVWLTYVRIASQPGTTAADVERLFGESAYKGTSPHLTETRVFPRPPQVPDTAQVRSYGKVTTRETIWVYFYLNKSGQVIRTHLAVSPVRPQD